MYTIKCQGRYEINVVGKGENGLCRINHTTNNVTVFSGTYAACVEWLAARGTKTLS